MKVGTRNVSSTGLNVGVARAMAHSMSPLWNSILDCTVDDNHSTGGEYIKLQNSTHLYLTPKKTTLLNCTTVAMIMIHLHHCLPMD